jgi:general stress protein 26
MIMSKLTLENISEKMRDIDICMMTTKTASGTLESRPMSNNREVDYKGDSYFFAYDDCSAAQEIKMDPSVGLSLIDQAGLLGKSLYLSITGKADLIKDRAVMVQHWVKDLELWFKDGLDTPGLVLIHVKASRIKYWHGMDEGELSV